MPRESRKSRHERLLAVADILAQHYPRSRCALVFDTPFQLLVATVLSAQTNDTAVNKVTPELFKHFPTAEAMATAPEGAIENCINSIGLWRNKSRFLRGLSQMLVEEYDGVLPQTLSELMRLPGVAHKTATAVLGTAFGQAAGVTVDTHMVRLHNLLGIVHTKDPRSIARELEAILPPQRWNAYTHQVIDHGRIVCVARRPRCGVCPLVQLCPSACKPEVGYRAENDARVPASAAAASWLVAPDKESAATQPD